MKNLSVLVNLNQFSSSLVGSQLFTIGTFDYNNNIFKRKCFIFTYKEGEIFALNPTDGNCVLLLSVNNGLSDVSSVPVCMFYNSIFNSLNLALQNGDVLSILLKDDLTPIDNEAQCVGCISSGLQTAVLSPDNESIVFLDGSNTLIIMTGNFEPLAETFLFGSDEGEQEMVNVGWGKKETQFHGSEGKAAAKIKIDDENKSDISEGNKQPSITWRGDSTLFAVSFWCPRKNYQRVKIFNKDGILQCTSEFVPGLQGILSWRPSGNLIALTQNLPNKYVVCFMEKNGLRHGDFTLPPNVKVLKLSWNCESTILCAVCEDKSTSESCILLWTTGNCHWYLKQWLNFGSAVVVFRWDDIVGNLCHILLADGCYLAFQWAWAVDHSVAVAADDLAVVAVIDSCDLKLTAFKKCVVPPPMCGATVELPSPALQVMFPHSDTTNKRSAGDPSPNDLCVYMSSGQLGFICGMESSPQLHRMVPVVWECPEISLPSPSSLSHWLWLSRDQLICVVCSGGHTHLCQIRVDAQAANVVLVSALEEAVLTVSHGMAAMQALVQLSSGALLQYQDGHLTPLTPLPELCVSVRVAGPHMFARTLNCHLHVDGELIANNVTSFFCLPGFLVMTLNTHQLCITRADAGFKLHDDTEGTTSRRLERGSTLVVVVGHSVVLQLPRGNLETVEPRALTLVTAAKLLDAGDYKSAAQLLRRQRIDLNLCVDHNPAAFFFATHRFVTQIRDPQWLSVFLAELNEHDVTRRMYAGHYSHFNNRNPPLTDKVNRVCTALRSAMCQTPEDQEFFLQPILSTYVRSGRVGEAIALADSEQALNHLALLISTDKLYEEALATYNLEKALKIAGKSLKDPKEYVAYLNELRGMEPAYMKFTIDKRLRKPRSALSNLAQCPDRRDECLQYVEDTALYTLALDLFKDQEDMYGRVCLQYGSYLLNKQQYHEAGLMLSRGGNVEGAIVALTRAGCWRQCLTLASQHNYSETAVSKLHQTLYSALHGSQLFSEAAQLCCHLGWQDKAVSCFTEAHSWSQAVFLCHSHHLTNLIDSVVKPALMDCQCRTLSDLRAKTEQLDKHCARLLVVREKKKNPNSNFDAMSEIQSDTSSIASFSTSSAGTRTTKNTRKAQRKLWSLKEGNPREEQALLYNITELVQNTERLTGEVHVSCLALTELDLDLEARTLHIAMSTALDHVDQVKHTVWPSSAIKKTGSDAEAVDPTSVDTQLSYPPASNVLQSWTLNIYM